MINYNFSIEITKANRCYTSPHDFIISCNEPEEIIKAIKLKEYPRYVNRWEVRIGTDITLIKGIKRIENLNEHLQEGREILKDLLNLSNFEINVAKELIEKE